MNSEHILEVLQKKINKTSNFFQLQNFLELGLCSSRFYARVWCLPLWSPSTYPWILTIQAINRALSCHQSHTLCPSLPAPAPTLLFSHLNISTGWHPIIHALMLQMPKPPQSALPNHICHTLYTQKTVQIFPLPTILQRHSTHRTFCPL